MGKTLILGNNPTAAWIKELVDVAVVPVAEISVNRDKELNQYIATNLPANLDCLIIDNDSIADTQLTLQIALRLRLMVHTLGKTALCAVLIATESDIETFSGYGPGSVMLMTGGMTLEKPGNIKDALRFISPLTPAEYVSDVLHLIKVMPQSGVEGRHSIANEWGVDVLASVISGRAKSDIISVRASSSLYFLYSYVVGLSTADVDRIVGGRPMEYSGTEMTVSGFAKVLLLDDEADKGWGKVLEMLMPKAEFDVWNQPARDYDELSSEIRRNISKGKYELIFLDLRMAGISEEEQTDPERFSGMKILKAIKKINPGIQVIMLTATNKGWNVKAMLDAGADGYYMKEAPEYHFPIKYSEQNALALKNEIENCMERCYLRGIYKEIVNVDIPTDAALTALVRNQMLISFDLVRKAVKSTDFAFAYISLEQVFEMIATSYFNEEEYEVNKGRILKILRSNCNRKLPEWSADSLPVWAKVATVYYVDCNGKEKDFGNNVKEDIDLRNDYIHENNKPKINADDYRNLFDSVMNLLSVL